MKMKTKPVKPTKGTPMTDFDLKPFCMPEGDLSRYQITEPFVKSGWRIATDARIIVAVPCDDDTPNTKGRKLPDAMELINAALDITAKRWADWPSHLGDSLVDAFGACPDCDGTGTHGNPSCVICRGAARHECACGCDHYCQACESVACLGCGGIGERVYPCVYRIGNRHFFPKLFRAVNMLPGVQWAADSDDPSGMLCLRFTLGDGRRGYGAVMPIDREDGNDCVTRAEKMKAEAAK